MTWLITVIHLRTLDCDFSPSCCISLRMNRTEQLKGLRLSYAIFDSKIWRRYIHICTIVFLQKHMFPSFLLAKLLTWWYSVLHKSVTEDWVRPEPPGTCKWNVLFCTAQADRTCRPTLKGRSVWLIYDEQSQRGSSNTDKTGKVKSITHIYSMVILSNSIVIIKNITQFWLSHISLDLEALSDLKFGLRLISRHLLFWCKI